MQTGTTILVLGMAVMFAQAAPAPEGDASESADFKKFRPNPIHPIQPVDNSGGYYPSVYDSSNFNPSYNPSYNPSGYYPDVMGGGNAPYDPFAIFRPWKLQEDNGVRQKREVCWFGLKACQLKCKFFGRGATQGRCLNGYCECIYPGQYPGYPGLMGQNGF